MSWRDYLPTVQETEPYTGPFSRFAEYHALGVGFVVVLADPALLGHVVAYAMGSGGGRSLRSGHARDAAYELAYTGLGAGLAIVARALGFV